MTQCNGSDAEDRDARASALAESLWPNRYVGDLTKAEWDRVYHLVDRASSDPLPGTLSSSCPNPDCEGPDLAHDGSAVGCGLDRSSEECEA